MNPRLVFWLSLLPIFVVAAIAGSRSATPPGKATPKAAPTPPPEVDRAEPDQPAAPTIAPLPEAKPAEKLDQYYAAMTDKTIWGEKLEQRLPKDLRFTEDLGVIAKGRYLDELGRDKLDTNWLWIVFRCGGAGLNALLVERLPEGVADSKEREAIHSEVERFTLPSSASTPLRIDDSAFNLAQAMAMNRAPIDRAIAARLLGTRDIEASRNALWQMGGQETDNGAQLAIVESLARIVSPTIDSWNRATAMIRSYSDKGGYEKGAPLERLIAAQDEIKRKVEEAWRRDNPSAPK